MNTAYRFIQAMGCVAALLLTTTESAMASSLMLLSPAQVAGRWTFYVKGGEQDACTVTLKKDRTFSAQVSCLQAWLGRTPTTWSPTPDGLLLIGKDGSQSLFLELREAGRYEGSVEGSKTLVMQRAHLQSVH